MRVTHPLYLPPFQADQHEPASLILRDGSTATIRRATKQDAEMMEQFVEHLSPESKRHRFFCEGTPSVDLVRGLCNNFDPRSQLTLIVTRIWQGGLRIIGAGSYWARNASTAEIAMAVDDAFHGKGLGTLLLERLALQAIRHGFTSLWAVTHADNAAMREVFRESGFSAHETYESGDIEVELSLVPTATTVTRTETRERLSTIASLRPFFYPSAVAVIGASRNPERIGHRILQAIVSNQFQGSIYPVNPYAHEILGYRAYPSVKNLPGHVDLALIAVPPEHVLPVVEDCATHGVRALVVVTAGFAEIGMNGASLQEQLVRKVRDNGMRMLGPNCFGLVTTNPDVHLNATFTSLFPPAGRVAMASQSGAIGLATLGGAHRIDLGISSFVSMGNKADVSTNDLLQYWEEDLLTDVILLYVESFGNPRRFGRIARRVSRRKPIVAVKAGRTQSGRRAAGSHTAALAATELAVEALFLQAGIIRAESLDEMMALAAGLANQPFPQGRRVGIITNAGGVGILCTDACESMGLVVPELSTLAKSLLSTFLPTTAALNNPVDLIASATPEQYANTISTLLTVEEVDALIVLYTSVTPADTAAVADGIRRGIEQGRQAGAKSKPVYIGWMAQGERPPALSVLTERVPVFASPESPATVLSKSALYAEWRQQPLGMVPDFDDLDLSVARQVCTTAIEQRGGGWLTTEETRNVLRAMKLPVQPGGMARTADEAVALAARMGYPVALKLASHRIVHKTEVGGVQLNLVNEQSVRKAFDQIRTNLDERNNLTAMEGVLVQPMVSNGVEVMAGVLHDSLFGPLIVFGLGGIYVDLMRDIQVRMSPLSELDATQMVHGIKGYQLLAGYRGHSAADIEAIEEVLLRISRLVEEIPEIVELDLNPIFALAHGNGCRIVDARIHVLPQPAG